MRILATISLFPMEQGGLCGPISREFNTPMYIGGAHYDCRLYLNDIGPLEPGRTYEAIPIEFLQPELVRDKLEVGAVFELWHGRIIAKGTISNVQ